MNFFLDIDGTLLPFGDRKIPESAVSAIENARLSGHRFFLATGRGPYEVPEYIGRYFPDGGVYASGALVIVGGKEIYRRVFTDVEKDKIFSYAREHNLLILAQSGECTQGTPDGAKFWNELFEPGSGGAPDIENLIISDEIDESMDMSKILYMSRNGIDLEDVRNAMLPELFTITNTLGIDVRKMGEIAAAGLSKATGVLRIMEYLGEDLDDFAAIGDGENDIEMVEISPYGVAMGNGSKEIREIAKYVSRDVRDDGLKDAIEHILEVRNGS